MLTGIAASDGIAIGRVLLLKKEIPLITRTVISSSEIKSHIKVLEDAIEKSIFQLKNIQYGSEADMVDILQSHIMILEDIELVNEIRLKIQEGKQDAISAADETLRFFADMFKGMQSEYMKERSEDITDIGYRLIMNMLGREIHSLSSIKEPVIIVAHDITPSDTAQMNKNMVLGFLTDTGGRTSHAAIMARSLEIPAILGLGNITSMVKNGDFLCFDGARAKIVINPDQITIKKYRKKNIEFQKEKDLLCIFKDRPSVSLDGHRVQICANIGNPSDAKKADEYGAEGIGLYRTEFLYMDRPNFPSEDEQFEAYKIVLETMGKRPVIIRTLDIGGDKNLPYLTTPDKISPFLGDRPMRLFLDRPEIFKVQLRALLRASIYGKLRIMYPMISCLEEVRAANAVLEECMQELDKEGIAYCSTFERGIMIEIPSAAIAADLIADEVDFFSIGTNDLIQYTCAVDRMNENTSGLYNPFNPAVLRLIKNVIDVAHANNIWCGVCGETAGDSRIIPLYLGMGLDEFSMSASYMLRARKLISSLSYQKMKWMSQEVLKIKTSDDIKSFIAQNCVTENAL